MTDSDGGNDSAATESVWDYPRPPAVRSVRRHVTVDLGGERIAETDDVVEVLETSHPPTVYLPRSAFVEGSLQPAEGSSWCEFKGRASYVDVVGGDARADAAGWYYPSPAAGYDVLVDRVAIYPGRMDRCVMDGEQVRPQEGGFYGGWVTSRVTGPFKGAPGTAGW